MTDLVLILTVVAFFLATALIVRACGRLIPDSVADDDGGEETS
ncbi:MAG TPA: hypothetical protein VEH29_07350 [Acidimicrobiales bacterium]|nr:hypothetical protein [Acidimicrobiales bacterium]